MPTFITSLVCVLLALNTVTHATPQPPQSATEPENPSPGCVYVCPPKDLLGFVVELSSSSPEPNPDILFCDYPAVAFGRHPTLREYFCHYNTTTGIKILDKDVAFCHANAAYRCPGGDGYRIILPKTQYPVSSKIRLAGNKKFFD